MKKLRGLKEELFLVRVFPEFPDVSAGFSHRPQGNMSLHHADSQNALRDRRFFMNQLGIDFKRLVCAKQVHKDRVVCVSEKDVGQGALEYSKSLDDTDALVTDIRRLPVGVFTADCLSIFFYDPKTPAIGIAHAGWRSSTHKIAIKTLVALQKNFGTLFRDVLVSFGPFLGPCCYEVKEDVREVFPQYTHSRGGKWFLDLAAVNCDQLLNVGVRAENIFITGSCTSCNHARYFSFRREGKVCGRMLSVIMLR